MSYNLNFRIDVFLCKIRKKDIIYKIVIITQSQITPMKYQKQHVHASNFPQQRLNLPSSYGVSILLYTGSEDAPGLLGTVWLEIIIITHNHGMKL